MAEEWIYGIHAVSAALEVQEVDTLWVARERQTDRRIAPLIAEASRQGLQVHLETAGYIARKCLSEHHQGILARALPRPEPDLPLLVERAGAQGFFLVLDGIVDPHNLGACLRSAEAAGVTAVILPRDNACPVNATVRKAAAGAASWLPVCMVTNLARTLGQMKDQGCWVVGLAGDGENTLYGTSLRGPLVLALGSEEKGLRRLVREQCDFLARIPMAGRMESLNVSVAAGIALFEAQRQRMPLSPAGE